MIRELLKPEPSALPAWSEAERLYFRRCMAASAAIYLVYAVFCAKFINYEEYFQVVEFASLKLGSTASTDLPWEHGARIRAWLQPGLYIAIARAAALFDVLRPLTMLFLFRLVTAFISWASVWMLIVAGRRWLADENDRRQVYLIAALLWLLPYLGVRTSSETMSTAMLCMGIALLEWRFDRPTAASRFVFAALAGLAFGFCFEFRFSTVVLAVGASLACLRPAAHRLSLFVGLLLGGLAALAIGALVDWWGYGAMAFPFLSYLDENFVAGKANTYGTAPFFAYIYLPLNSPMAPVALFLIAATIVAWVRRPRNVLVLSSILYVVVLSVTSHKEGRFIFPVTSFLPFFIVFALGQQPVLWASRMVLNLRKIATGFSLRILIAWNVCGLVAIPIIDVCLGEFAVYRSMESAIYTLPAPQNVVVIRGNEQEVGYSSILRLRFLEPKSIQWAMNPDIDRLNHLSTRDTSFLALVDVPNGNSDSSGWISDRCEFLRSSPPRWVTDVSAAIGNGNSSRRELYTCGRP